jgi:hypothetical protein
MFLFCSAEGGFEVFEGCHSVEKAKQMENSCVLHHNSTFCLSCSAVVFGEEANSSNPPAPICSRSHSLRFMVCKTGSEVMVLFFVMSSLTGGTVHKSQAPARDS